jgi:multiple sugar transport system substrate-binding protein
VTELRILCWDQPRCTAPTAAAAAEWTRRHPDTDVRWDARPLAAFNDQPIAAAVRGYDLVFVDHPMMGETAAAGCLAPLDDLLDPAELAVLAADSIAGGHDTYNYAGRQWAVAVDAACQVAVADEEALARLDETTPGTWPEVLDLARRRPGLLAIPLYPSDAFLALLSLSANVCAASARPLPPTLIVQEAAELLGELVSLADPRSHGLNPPALLDLMSGGDPGGSPGYAPLIFGYCGYQRGAAGRRRLRFRDIPSHGAEPSGAVLGGAGLAVTAESPRPREAASFARWLAGTAAQRDIVCAHGGQPASAAVWADPAADDLVGGFFTDTRATIDRAYVRPRLPWWPRFQEEAGRRLVTLLAAHASARRVETELAEILDRHRDEKGER